MASGDVVADIYTTTTNFQPSVGVQICITQFLTDDENGISGVGDINTSGSRFSFTSSTGHSNDMRFWNGFVNKFLISNSSYVRFEHSGGYMGFSGIEI
jgi:hypothetical protein